MHKLSLKTYMITFLLLLGAIGIYLGRQPAVLLSQLFLAVFSAVVLDLAIYYFRFKKLAFPSSAIITGLIVGMVIFPGQKFWYSIVASALGIISKHVLRINNRHIFNPASLGLLLVNCFWGAILGWWAVNIWLLIIPGIFIAFMVKREHLVISYLLTTAILLMAYALLNNGRIFDYFPMINLYFVFVMLIEPKTSPLKMCRGTVFATLVASLSFIFYVMRLHLDYSVASLTLGNLFNLLMERTRRC